jgi:hypothetical protein
MKRPVRPCGSYAAYRRHIAHREVPCDACRAAALAYSRAGKRHRASQMDMLWTELLDLITAECRSAGLLP